MVGQELHGDGMHRSARTPTWRGADNMHAVGGVESAVQIGEDKSSPPRAPTSRAIGFSFVQQAVVRRDDDDGKNVSVHQCQRAVFQFTAG